MDNIYYRDIKKVLEFRDDISQFLVHLTRNDAICETAEDALFKIIEEKSLRAKNPRISDARFGTNTMNMKEPELMRYFSAVCFTETPLNEVHCMIHIADRGVDLQPYGLVFLKKNLAKIGVSPVIYINNENADREPIVQALCGLIEQQENIAAEILPLIAVFGKKLAFPKKEDNEPGDYDFSWEREWRYPFSRGPLKFTARDVFVGLCPDVIIPTFEERFRDVEFIDPTRNMKYYAEKLLRAEERRKENLDP